MPFESEQCPYSAHEKMNTFDYTEIYQLDGEICWDCEGVVPYLKGLTVKALFAKDLHACDHTMKRREGFHDAFHSLVLCGN